jgi:CHAD domain-containing protein
MKLKASQSAAANAQEVLPKMARKYFHAGRKAMRSKPGELHRFRIETKRFRYTLELFRPVYGPLLDRYIERLRHLQSVLGKVSDYQAIQRVVAADSQLELRLRQELKKRVKDLRREWKDFDTDGALKRWRLYLGREHAAKPAAKRARRKPT